MPINSRRAASFRPALGWCAPADAHRLAGAVVVGLTAFALSCSHADKTNPAGPTPAAHIFNVVNVEGNRWAQSGNYVYSVQYMLANVSGTPATYSLLDFTLTGPSGETLPGYSSVDVGRAISIAPGTTMNTFTSLNGTDPGHPYAERMRMRVTYQAQDGRQGTLTDEDIVLHGPQTARLHDFSMSPPGFEPGAPPTPGVRLGEAVTVRWNVEGGSLIVLESTLPMTAAGGDRFEDVVEPVGSRTFITRRDGVASATLDIDRGRIRRLLLIGVNR